MVVAASIIAKAILEIWLVGSKTETVPGESNVVFISIINIGLFLSNKAAKKHCARRLQVIVFNVLKDPKSPKAQDPKSPFHLWNLILTFKNLPADYLTKNS